MNIFLKENETMEDLVERLVSASEIMSGIAPLAYWYENLYENGRIKDIHFSPRMRELLGYRSVEEFPDELNTLMTFVHPDDVSVMLENAIAAGTGKIDEYNVEYRLRNASGSYTWCNATGQLVKDSKGKTVGMYGAFIDISGKKSIDENAIINSFAQEYDAAFLDNLSSRTYSVLNNKDKVADKISGIKTTGQALRKYVQEFVHPDDAYCFAETFQAETIVEKLKIGQTVNFEFRSNTSGEYQWYRASFKRLNDNDVLIGFSNCNDEVLERLADSKLLNVYDAIYIAELDKNTIQPVRKSRVTPVGVFKGAVEYDKQIIKFADTVAPKYKQDWLNFSSPAFMKQYLAKDNHREYIYELPGAALTMRRFTVDVLERVNGEASIVLFSFAGIDDLHAQSLLMNKRMAEQKVLLDYFVNSYDSAYTVDLTDDSFEVFHMDEESARVFGSCGNGRDGMDKFIDKFVHPDDQAMVRQFVRKDYVKNRLRKEPSFSFTLREIINGEEKIKRGRLVRISDAEHIAVGFMDITEEIHKEQKQNELIAEQAAFTNFFLGTYVSAYYVDFNTLSCQIYKRTANLEREYPIITNYFNSLKEYINKDVHPDDRANLLQKVTPDNMRAILEKAPEYTHTFRDLSGGKEKIFRMQVIRGADADHAAFGFKDVSEEIAKENEAQRHIAIEQNNRRIMALEDNLESLYDVDLETGRYTEYVKGDFYKQNVTEKLVREGDFFSDILENIKTVIFSDDQEGVTLLLERNYLRQALSETDRIEHFYRLNVGEKPVWFKIRIVYKDSEKKSLIIGCFNASQELEAKQLEERNAKIAEEQKRNDILHDIIHSGKWSFFVDADDNITRAEISAEAQHIINNDIDEDGYTWTDILHPDDKESSLAAFKATLTDHSCKTPYDVVYRMKDRNGNYNWFHSAGRIIRNKDGEGEFFGVHIDVTDTIHEQQMRLLGAVPISPDVLSKAKIGMWAFELDEGKPPRMYADDTMLYLLGLDHQIPPEEIYHAWYDHIDYGSYDLVTDAVGKMTTGEHAEVQYPWHHPDGRTMIVRCGGFRNRKYTKGIRIEGTHQDVTETLHFDEEQNKMERELATQQRHLKSFGTMINAASWNIVLKGDSEIVAVEWSDSLRKMFGFNNEKDFPDVLESWTGRIHPEDKESTLANFKKSISIKEENLVCDVTFRFQRKTKEYVWYHAYGRMENVKDNERNFYGIIVDISSEKQIMEQREQLKEALAMAQSASRAKTTFLNNMSHDIRTPMNAIIGYTGLAASHINNRNLVLDYLTKIGQSSNHLLSLINDVLDMSRIESGKMNLDEKEEYLPDIIHTLRDIVQADVRSKQHDFFIDTVNVNDEHVICDKLRVNQVLLNILSNAIKYTAPGGTISMRITEKTVKSSGYATYEFCVKDNGMGMEENFLKTIFDPFSRVKSSTMSGIQGTGLGMAITKNIIDMMGGKIEIKSELGKGTEIKVSFDFKLTDAPKKVTKILELKGAKGLVADDDSNTCLSISKMLKDVGMRAEWCTSGKEAIIRADAAYKEGDVFKVYIIDWLMPDMNGIETTRRIRKVIGEDAPIIILTAYDWSDIEEEAREAGVTAFVSKPMFPSDLRSVLAKCIGIEDETETPEAQPFSLEGKKILLVEDNELNREIATAVLEEYGCQVCPAEDGDIAVGMMTEAKAGDYDLILMDVQMPTIDGYEATRQIRALGTEISRIPILAMTANAFEEDRKLALEAGMNDHIAKPIDIKILKETLSKYLS